MNIPSHGLVAFFLMLGVGQLYSQDHADLGKLTDYPVVKQVWLGSIVGEVSVDPEIPIEVSTPGELQWKVEDGAVVTKNQVIAVSQAKKIELSARDLDIKRNRLQNSLLDIQTASLDKKRTLETSIEGLEGKLAEMKLTDSEQELLGADFAKRLAVERAKLSDEIKRQREKLDGDYFETSEALDKLNLKLDLEKAENDHAELVRSAEIKAEFDGKVIIESREPILKTTIIAEIVRTGQAEIKLELSDPRLRNTRGEELTAEINGEDGKIYRAVYSRDSKERSINRNGRICIFEIEHKNKDEVVPPTLTGMRLARVARILVKPGRALDKNKFLFTFSKEISENGWANFIEKRWPGVHVTYVAPKVVIVNSANEN